MVQKDQVLIFSQTVCYASANLKDWEIRSIPERYLTPDYSDGPFPVLFRGRLYIAGKDGLYYSDDAALNWSLGFKAQIEVVTVDENWLYIFQANGSYRSSDGVYFQSLAKLDNIIKPIPRNPDIYLTFAKAEGGEIVLSGLWNTGMEYEFTSFDAGLTWQSSSFILINDVCLGEKVASNHSGYYFIAQGPLEIYQKGGTFWTLEKFKGDYYFAGETDDLYSDGIKTERGIIIKNNNFDSAFICPEKIRELEVIHGNLMAIGDKGTVYMLE
ncbi:MAG: hypothetical protein PF488_00295 [Patescibacteria group bacterium]|nr:hypothetical protein [Patescibacteria group bacterium]